MIEILYQDKFAIIAKKPIGVLSAPTPDETECIGTLLSEQLSIPTPLLVHRLDRNVSGAMLMALRKDAAGKFSALVSERSFDKEYLAIVHDTPKENSGIYKDLLFKDSASNKTYTTDKMRKGVKDASLEYKTLQSAETEDGILSLVRIKLHTGRTHQIRVQFSSRQTPLFGDGKYGSHTNRGSIALFSARLSFLHPFTNKPIDVKCLPDTSLYPWNAFSDTLNMSIFEEKIIDLQ